MGTISTGVGLVSGLNIQDLVSQLMQLEARPLNLIKNRIVEAKTKQTAYEALRVSFQASQGAINRLAQTSSFRVKTATSSNEDILTASATPQAVVNNYSFRVKQLVTSQQVISKTGFATANSTAVGAGQLVFRSSKASVGPDTALATLNDGDGVSRGRIHIVDSAGNDAEIDLRFALNVSDVLEAINGATGIDVRARVSGDRIVIEDLAGGAGNLRIEEVDGGTTALDLGILASSSTGLVTGTDIYNLNDSTLLSALNDERGLEYNGPGEDDLRITLSNGRVFEIDFSEIATLNTSLAEFNGGQGVGAGTIRITNRLGASMDLTLTGNETFGEINALIESQQPGFGVRITSVSGSGSFIVSDSNEGEGTLKIEDVEGTIAEQMEMAAESKEGESTIAGKAIYSFKTLGALISKIANARDTNGVANDGDLTIEMVDNALRFTDNTGSSTLVEAMNDSNVAANLGLDAGFNGSSSLTTRDLIAGLNTVFLRSLNGGDGFTLGSATFTLKDGSSSGPIDFSGAVTLQDVVDLIDGVQGLEAEVGEGGVGIVITDVTGGAGKLSVSGGGLDVFNLTTNKAGQIVSGDLHRQHIYESTLLADLRNGSGIEFGAFQITDSSGAVATITLNASTTSTVGDVINAINRAGIGVTARISDNGDGITLEDTAGGDGSLIVSETSNASTAADLGLLGESDEGLIEGSFSGVIDIGASDTLNDVVTKINQAGIGLRASVINDGSGINPYKLIVSSQTPGSDGAFVYSGTGTKISLNTLSEAQDALLVIGDPDSPNSVLISSSSNTVTDAIDGVTLELHGTSDDPVSLTVDRDIDSIMEDVRGFVETFNATLSRIGELTSYDPETEQKGALFSEGAVRTLTARLFQMLGGTFNHSDLDIRTLNEIGIFIDSSGGQGARLTMQRTYENGFSINGEERLRKLLEEDIEAVEKFFTKLEVTEVAGKEEVKYIGFGARFKRELDGIVNGFDGVLTTESRRVQERIDLFQKRADNLQVLLDRKEERLYAEFQAMESALASLQSQQSSLTALANLAGSLSAQQGG